MLLPNLEKQNSMYSLTAGYATMYNPRKEDAGRQSKKRLDEMQLQANTLDENRMVVFKKGRAIGDGFYIVEISTTKK